MLNIIFMKRVIFALGILCFYHNETVAQSTKFVQQINTNAYGEGLFDFTGHINPGGEKYFFIHVFLLSNLIKDNKLA